MCSALRAFRLLAAAATVIPASACGGGDDATTAVADATTETPASSIDATVEAEAGLQDAAQEAESGLVEDVVQESVPDAGDAAPPDATPDVASDSEEDAALPFRLRIAAANLTSENGQSYDAGHGTRILQGIHPDIVLMQEFKYGDNSNTAIRAFVDMAFAPSFAYYRETGAQIPNGIISRYPIADAGTWDDPEVSDRGFAWARIDLPGPRDLWAVSVHLLNSGTVGERDNEAKAILGYVNASIASPDTLVVVGGDMNTQTRTESCFTTLGARFVTAGPWPVDQASNGNTNAKRELPYDWVMASPALDVLQAPVVIGANTFPSGLVVDTRVYTPIGDLSPALQTDSAATNMQHMAVVREFVITL